MSRMRLARNGETSGPNVRSGISGNEQNTGISSTRGVFLVLFVEALPVAGRVFGEAPFLDGFLKAAFCFLLIALMVYLLESLLCIAGKSIGHPLVKWRGL